MKIYAKQVPPEYQESPLFYGDFPENIIVTGNRDFNSHTIPLYDRILDCYDEAAQEIENINSKNGYAAYETVTEAINDYFPALEYRTKPYNTRDIHRIRVILEWYGTRRYYEDDHIVAMLEAITGEAWSSATIRGCCQSDWQDIIYPINAWSAEAIKYFEMEYFNTGTEWIIHDGNTEPETPEDIYGFSCYCYTWNAEALQREIANIAGYPDADVILCEYAGNIITPKYMEVKNA